MENSGPECRSGVVAIVERAISFVFTPGRHAQGDTVRQAQFRVCLTVGESSSIDDKVTLPVLVTLNAYVMVSPTAARPSSLAGMYETPMSDTEMNVYVRGVHEG